MSVTALGPLTSDGKPILLINLFPGDVSVNYAGVGDDITNGVRGSGQLLQASTALVEDLVTEWQFKEWVYLAGGIAHHKNANFGDWITYELYAPATVGTSNPGAGAYAKQAVGGGLSRFKPQANGDWDLNLTEKLNANVGFTKVVPVPNEGGTGYFDWDDETETVTANADGKGSFDLFDAALPLGKFITKVPLLNSGTIDFTVPAVKPKKILAHWKHKLTLHHVVVAQTDLVWMLFTARKKTT